MVKYFLMLCAFIFCIVGICEFVYLLRKIFTYPGIHTYNYSLVFLRQNYAVKQLRYIWQKYKWQGSEFAHTIFAVTDFIDYEEVDYCRQFSDGKNIILCDNATLNEYLLLYEENN